MSWLTRLVSILALPSLLACGGRLGDAAGSALPDDAGALGEDGPSLTDAAAGDDANAPVDASLPCAQVIAGIERGSDGGREFGGQAAFLAYFQSLASLDQLVVPAHHVDCSSGAADAGACTYDPRQPRLDAADIHYSNDLHEFTGPDGQPWIWAYIKDRDTWLAADEITDPSGYACLVEYNH